MSSTTTLYLKERDKNIPLILNIIKALTRVAGGVPDAYLGWLYEQRLVCSEEVEESRSFFPGRDDLKTLWIIGLNPRSLGQQTCGVG